VLQRHCPCQLFWDVTASLWHGIQEFPCIGLKFLCNLLSRSAANKSAPNQNNNGRDLLMALPCLPEPAPVQYIQHEPASLPSRYGFNKSCNMNLPPRNVLLLVTGAGWRRCIANLSNLCALHANTPRTLAQVAKVLIQLHGVSAASKDTCGRTALFDSMRCDNQELAL
jgi:hypothetical protein